MQLKRIMTALAKNDVTVVPTARGWRATKSDVALEFSENGRGSGLVGYFVERSPETKPEFDNFCDSYYYTIKAALSRFGVHAAPKQPALASSN